MSPERRALVVTLVVAVGSVLPSGGAAVPTVSMLPVAPDKLVHAGSYAVLSTVAVAVVVQRRRRLAVAGGYAFGVGLALELVQATLPYRSFEIADLVANALGVGLGLLAWWVVRRGTAAPSRR